MQYLFLACLGYLLGSIPFGYIAGKMHNIDLRKVGSGSTGGTNVYRALGIRWAAAAGLLDVAKGLVFLFLVSTFTNVSVDALYYLSVAPIVGHIFPIWLNFKGGKGVSVSFGGLIYLLGAPFALVVTVVWLVALKLVKIMSLVNLVLFLLLPVYVYMTTQSIHPTLASVLIMLLVWWAHRENIVRLLTHSEKKLNV